MAENIILNGIILLFDNYSVDSQHMHDSFKRAGLNCSVIILEDNNFFPDDIMSVYDMILGYFEERGHNLGKPRFFNEIAVPEQWSINLRAYGNDYGDITYQHEEKGRIFYLEDEKKCFVKAVDWLDRKGNIRFRDHYNRYGFICARSYYGEQGREIGKTWFSVGGQEVIVENATTGELIVNDGKLVKFFRTKVDMMLYFFHRAGIEKKQIFYNSLALSCQISYRLNATEKGDILFWQEDIHEEIPGNMQTILNGQTPRTKKIIVQKKSAYDRLLELGADPDKIQLLGYLYDLKKKNGHGRQALICTNSDQIEHCEELIKTFPQMHFHIAAVTLMSCKLKELGTYDNVSLYEGAQTDTIDTLFRLCDYYFDINYWKEIVSAVYRAFLHDQLIFAFEETVHNKTYVADKHIYPVKDFDKMVLDIKSILESTELMDRHLDMQHKNAVMEERETYVRIIDEMR